MSSILPLKFLCTSAEEWKTCCDKQPTVSMLTDVHVKNKHQALQEIYKVFANAARSERMLDVSEGLSRVLNSLCSNYSSVSTAVHMAEIMVYITQHAKRIPDRWSKKLDGLKLLLYEFMWSTSHQRQGLRLSVQNTGTFTAEATDQAHRTAACIWDSPGLHDLAPAAPRYVDTWQDAFNVMKLYLTYEPHPPLNDEYHELMKQLQTGNWRQQPGQEWMDFSHTLTLILQSIRTALQRNHNSRVRLSYPDDYIINKQLMERTLDVVMQKAIDAMMNNTWINYMPKHPVTKAMVDSLGNMMPTSLISHTLRIA